MWRIAWQENTNCPDLMEAFERQYALDIATTPLADKSQTHLWAYIIRKAVINARPYFLMRYPGNVRPIWIKQKIVNAKDGR